MIRWLADLRRGWSDIDLSCALSKFMLSSLEPGGVVVLSGRELRAYAAWKAGYRPGARQ